VPIRVVPQFGCARKYAEPDPVNALRPATVSHSVLLPAVQSQPGGADAETPKISPSALNRLAKAPAPLLHDASCDTSTITPPMATVAVLLAEASRCGETRSATVPGASPDPPDNTETHHALLLAV
jgi:hypothetical protein